jgi:hypothetical protein
LRFAIHDYLIDSRDALFRVRLRVFQQAVPVTRVALRREQPVHPFDIGADRYRFQKVNREPLRGNRRKTFENPVFKMREPLRQTEFVFVGPMVVAVQRATDCATMGAVVTGALDDFICRVMRLETREILFLDGGIAVKRFHDFSW